jgi:hypothetical protein
MAGLVPAISIHKTELVWASVFLCGKRALFLPDISKPADGIPTTEAEHYSNAQLAEALLELLPHPG